MKKKQMEISVSKMNIIVSNVIVRGYVKHSDGKKTMFEFNKHDFKPNSLMEIFKELRRKYEGL